MPASTAEGSSSNSISGGNDPQPDPVVPLTTSQDGEANRTRDENGNWTGETRQAIVAVAPVPAAPATAASAPTDAAQPNVSPAGVTSVNSPNRRVRMAERQEQRQGREQELHQHPIDGYARQQFIMRRPHRFYANAIDAFDAIDDISQPAWPQVRRGSMQAGGYFRRTPPALPYLSSWMATVPIYSSSHSFRAGSPSCPLNYFADGRSSPYRFPRPLSWGQRAAAALPMVFEHVAPPADLPPPMRPVLLECPGALAQAAPNAPLLAMVPHGIAGGWGVLQPTAAVPASGLEPSERSAGRASSPDSGSPEVVRADVDARPVSEPATAGISTSGGDQRQTTGVYGTAMHAPPRPAARSGPAAGTPPAAGSLAYASHAAGAMASAAGSWRMQDGGATGWTPTAALHVAGPALVQATLLAPSFVGSSFAVASPQPSPAGQHDGQQQYLLPAGQHDGQQQQYLMGYITAPSQPWQQNFSPRHQLQQQQHQLQPARRMQASVAISSFEAAPAQVGHDPRSPATSQTEGEQQRAIGSSVNTPPQLQYDQNSLQSRRRSQADVVARAASTSPDIDDAVQRFSENVRDILDGSDSLGVSFSILDIASDSE